LAFYFRRHFLFLLGASAKDDVPPTQRNLRQVLGVAHVAGAYNPGGGEGAFLEQGAREIFALGSSSCGFPILSIPIPMGRLGRNVSGPRADDGAPFVQKQNIAYDGLSRMSGFGQYVQIATAA